MLEEREEEIKSLQSDLQQKNSDITGWCDISICLFVKTLKVELTIDFTCRAQLHHSPHEYDLMFILASHLFLMKQRSPLMRVVSKQDRKMSEFTSFKCFIQWLMQGKMPDEASFPFIQV